VKDLNKNPTRIGFQIKTMEMRKDLINKNEKLVASLKYKEQKKKGLTKHDDDHHGDVMMKIPSYYYG
jgi:hypothetical protein